MLLVRQAADIPVPAVYALFNDKARGYNLIVQEYVPDKDIEKCWKGLDGCAKEAIVGQLRRYPDTLRNLQPPVPGILVADDAGASRPNEGPCDTEQEGVDIMPRVGLGTRSPTRPFAYLEWVKHVFHSIFRGHDSLFTYSDLAQANSSVRDDGTPVLIDWPYSGWYPSYLEYCAALSHGLQEDGWNGWVCRFLGEHVAELGWMLNFWA